MEQKDLLFGRMEDLARKAVKTGFSASRFLTPTEAKGVAAYFTHRHEVKVVFDGGFDNAERVRAVFLDPDWGEYGRDELFAALKIDYRPQDTLTHRDILGALMALGVERDTIGDIVAESPPAAMVALPELGGYIADNLTKAGRVGVTVTETAPGELPARAEKLGIKTDTVASLRLDAVLGAAFDLSRTKAAELIAAGRVSVDHELCLRPAKELAEGALLSVRGMGRAKLMELGGLSRKARMFIRIGIYE